MVCFAFIHCGCKPPDIILPHFFLDVSFHNEVPFCVASALVSLTFNPGKFSNVAILEIHSTINEAFVGVDLKF